MKLATVCLDDHLKLALLDVEKNRYWLVSELVDGFDGDMIQLVQDYAHLKNRLVPSGDGYSLAGTPLHAPIANPRRNILCVGKNYHSHAVEFSKSGFDSSTNADEHAPEAPVVFTKAPSTVIAPNMMIPLHAGVTQQVDYEAELAIVIGKPGRAIKKADALDHVFGYTIVNDVTARDLQKRHRQWFLGKSLDGFCPMGPYVATADELDGQNLDIECWVNGELRQSSNTRHLIFDLPTLIETISAAMTLQAGDVIATGTPAGVGIGFTPPKFLVKGDVIRIAIQGLGVLENTVGD